MKDFNKKINNQKGQGLVEIIAAIAIGTVLILALVSLSVRANRSADFSKAEDQAAKLASEGIEVIQSVKADQRPHTAVHLYNSGSWKLSDPGRNWNDIFDASINFDDNDGDFGYAVHVHSSNPSSPEYDITSCNLVPYGWCLDLHSYGDPITLSNRLFNRYIFIADTPVGTSDPNGGTGKSKCNTSSTDYVTIKQFTVLVEWSDTSGTHQSISTNCLQR